jgi:hypothetical protein
MSKSILSVRDIIERGGGPRQLNKRSQALARLDKSGRLKEIAEKTIYSWIENGIPEKHWSFVMPQCSVSEGELHRANELLRKGEISRVRPRQRAADARAA